MTASISLFSLTSSFSSLSFSSQISAKPLFLPLSCATTLSRNRNPSPSLVVSSLGGTSMAPEVEGMSLERYAKSRLLGGFAVQKLIGTGRRKCAIARVVLQEGSGKIVINCRDAKKLEGLRGEDSSENEGFLEKNRGDRIRRGMREITR